MYNRRKKHVPRREKKNYYIEAEPEGKLNLALWGKNLMTL